MPHEMYNVLSLKFIELGHSIMPHNNPDDLDEINQTIVVVETILNGLYIHRAKVKNGETTTDMKFSLMSEWLSSCELLTFKQHPTRNLNIHDTVYFYTNPYQYGVKVGYTDQLPTRIKTLEREIAKEHNIPYAYRGVETLYVKTTKTNTSAPKLEAALHNTLRDWRLHGEWFETEGVSMLLEQCFPTEVMRIRNYLET